LFTLFFSFLAKTLKDFKALILTDPEVRKKISQLRTKVNQFASKFPIPGFDDH